jgi:hypothetical protein
MDSNVERSGLTLAIATILAIVSTLVVNTLSNLYPLGGQNVGEIANTLLAGVLITPANYAFAIWGVIYLGLIAYALYQFPPGRRSQPHLQRVNRLLIVACLAQVLWILLFTLRQFSGSVLAMLVILISLVGIYLTLRTGLPPRSRRDRWCCQIPFSIYLAWIAVATVVNVASALYAAGWRGWGLSPVGWTLVMTVVVTLLGGWVLWQRRDLAFVLVFVWALGAIALRHSGSLPALTLTAGGAALLLLGLVGFDRLFSRGRGRPTGIQ